MPEETLAAYRPKTQQEAGAYTIEDHKHLADGSRLRPLFERLRKEIVALEPSVVTEDFLKHYVSYKAETNFADLQAQASNLKLHLNMQFDDLDDPKRLARDVTGIGHYGMGDVEVFLRNQEELPYVMSLVRQAFESQMEEGA